MVQQIGQVIKLRPEAYEEYKRLHADVWPDVLAMLHKANIRNYSIFHWTRLLFASMEYIGADYEADMAAIADDRKTRAWWQFTRSVATSRRKHLNRQHRGQLVEKHGIAVSHRLTTTCNCILIAGELSPSSAF